MLLQIRLPEGIELAEFQPSVGFFPGINLLHYLGEDCTAVDVPVVGGRYHDWDLQLHGHDRHAVGTQFWLRYNPQRLLPAPA